MKKTFFKFLKKKTQLKTFFETNWKYTIHMLKISMLKINKKQLILMVDELFRHFSSKLIKKYKKKFINILLQLKQLVCLTK